VAYPPGFNYVSGPCRLQLFEVTSADTFAARNPVCVTGAGTISQYSDVATVIAGIAQSESSQSIAIAGKNYVSVLVPEENTVFATKVQTGVASSALTAMSAFNIEIATNHFRLDTDSTVTKIVQNVPRESGSADADSTDSTVFVRFLPGALKFSSPGTVRLV
jgi:hypothetical protein